MYIIQTEEETGKSQRKEWETRKRNKIKKTRKREKRKQRLHSPELDLTNPFLPSIIYISQDLKGSRSILATEVEKTIWKKLLIALTESELLSLSLKNPWHI